MTYRVTFRKRFNIEGEESDRPETFVQVLDGVVLNASKSEVIEPPAQHSQEVLDEDDNFESLGTETWEYEVRNGREREFLAALENSRMVIQYEEIGEVI
jgi:hypothetical protein